MPKETLKKPRKKKVDTVIVDEVKEAPEVKEVTEEEKKEKTKVMFPRIMYKVSKTPFKAFADGQKHKIAWQDYIYLRKLDILIQERQTRIIAFLNNLNKSWETLTRLDLQKMEIFIRANLK